MLLSTVVDCGGPEIHTDWSRIAHADVTLLNATTTYGSVANVTCLQNTVAIGDVTWVCDKHGQWTKPWNFRCASEYSNIISRFSYA